MVVGAEQEDDSLAIFGKGFYFSKSADKAHYYTHGGGKLLVAIVAMGSCTTVITPDRARTTPPLPIVSANDAIGDRVEKGDTVVHSMLVPGRPRYFPVLNWFFTCPLHSLCCRVHVRVIIKLGW